MFRLEGSFFQDGEDTVARLHGQIGVDGIDVKKMSAKELNAILKGDDGVLRKAERAAEKKLGAKGIRFWSDGFTARKDEVIWNFRLTVMDFNGFDGLASAIKDAFGGAK